MKGDAVVAWVNPRPASGRSAVRISARRENFSWKSWKRANDSRIVKMDGWMRARDVARARA